MGFNKKEKPVIYADDVSVIVTASNELELKTQINHTLNYTMEWFSVNELSLNWDKTIIMKFLPSNKPNNNFQIILLPKLRVAANNTKFLV